MLDDGLLTRRRAIATIGAAAGALLSPGRKAAGERASAAEIAHGTVFDCQSDDGQRRSRDRGIAGVMVSNGRDIVITDDDGRWSLPVEAGGTIFTVTPPQWTALTRGPAAFSYLHQPKGTPAELGLRSPVLAPTGALPISIDFALQRQAQSSRFEALLFADTQAADARELSYVRSVLLEATRKTRGAFAVHHGDAMADDLTLFPEYLRILNETGIAWHHCPGNHDMNLDAPDSRHAFETWKRFIGPTSYAFQYAGATFILLNNVEYFGCDNKLQGGRAYRGRIGNDQLRFIDNVLRNVPQNDLIVVSMHIPLQSFDNPDGAADTTIDRTALLRLLSHRPYSVSFAGHSHTTEHHYFGGEYSSVRDEPHHHHVLTAACGSWWSGPCDPGGVPIADSRDGTPKGFHVLSVDGNQYATRFVPLGSAPEQDLRILISATDENTELFVDVFDGGPLTRVTCEIAGEPASAVALERAGIPDPYVVEIFARYRALCKPWVAAAPSSHVWKALLPEHLESRKDALVVRVRDEYGASIVRRVTG